MKPTNRRLRWLASAAAAGLMAFGLAVAQGQDSAPERKPEHLVQVETTDGKTVKGRYRDQGDSVVLDTEEGKRIAHALGGAKAAILRNHGNLTVGRSVDEAVWWFVTMERTCQAQLLAEAAGTPVLIDEESAALTLTQVGSDAAGWLSYQPLYDWITRSEPDLFH